ncbi:MAG: PDZ domain-containing protein [Sandaracinus sp.]|nr:PDZ domain-containing protein [Myxococcales bacterium]MCB9616656.1 PDZ domain-containing protein [Sandaracinus sp.]
MKRHVVASLMVVAATLAMFACRASDERASDDRTPPATGETSGGKSARAAVPTEADTAAPVPQAPGWLGVRIETVDADLADERKLAVRQGVRVAEVGANTPAAKHGLMAGDVVVAVDGARTLDDASLARPDHHGRGRHRGQAQHRPRRRQQGPVSRARRAADEAARPHGAAELPRHCGERRAGCRR